MTLNATTSSRALAALVVTAGALAFGAPEARAQVQLGNSQEAVAQALGRAGYGAFRILDREVARTVVEACRGDRKFRLSVNLLGQVKVKEPRGACDLGRVRQAQGNRDAERGGPLTTRMVVRRLRRQGYSDIEARPAAAGTIVADACKGGERHRLRFDARGDNRPYAVVGICRDGRLVAGTGGARGEGSRGGARGEDSARGPAPSLRKIRDQLRERGYYRIRYTDRELPGYRAEACDRRDRRVSLLMGRNGEIREQSRIGNCEPRNADNGNAGERDIPRNQRAARRTLRRLGFNRIQQVEVGQQTTAFACRREKRFEVVLNRRNELISQNQAGFCTEKMDVAKLTEHLRKVGLFRIQVRPQGENFAVAACEGAKRMQLVYNAYAERISAREQGPCPSASVLDVVTTLESRGAENVSMVLEGCFRGDKYRWHYNRVGDRVRREKVGRCDR